MTDVFYHAKRDPLQCTDDAGHDFTGWREFDDVFGSIAREGQSDE